MKSRHWTLGVLLRSCPIGTWTLGVLLRCSLTGTCTLTCLHPWTRVDVCPGRKESAGWNLVPIFTVGGKMVISLVLENCQGFNTKSTTVTDDSTVPTLLVELGRVWFY